MLLMLTLTRSCFPAAIGVPGVGCEENLRIPHQGIVNLSQRDGVGVTGRRGGAMGGGRSGRDGHASDRAPGGEALGSGLAVDGSGQAVAARAAVGGAGAVGGEEALGGPRRREPPPPPLPLARRLVGVLRPVVQALVPPGARHVVTPPDAPPRSSPACR